MTIPTLSTSPHDYVVLDVETNGLRCREHDLLSISIYKPDDNTEYDRFLPLDLNDDVYTTHINGITARQLKEMKHLTQDEVNELFRAFELDKRIILHYGSLDERFIREYFNRHGISGYEKMNFFNFKRMICSSQFSDCSLSKDRLCEAFGIEGVTTIHTGINDCKLEWKLFQAFDGHYILATMRDFTWQFNVLAPDYIVPVSYLNTFPNLSRLYERPYICFDKKEIYRLVVSDDDIRRFKSNFAGVTIEWLIDVMLDAEEQDNTEFLINNFNKNKSLGSMKHDTRPIFMRFNQDGTVTVVNETDKIIEQQLNATLAAMKKQLSPLIQFIKNDIFYGKKIKSQELVINNELGILAICDLSTDDAVLEIKTTAYHIESYAEQLFYESAGRKTYLLAIDWIRDPETRRLQEADFIIFDVSVFPSEKPNKRRERTITTLTESLEPKHIELISYTNSISPVKVRCKNCGHEWEDSYSHIKTNKCACPVCHPEYRVRPYVRRKLSETTRHHNKMTPAQLHEIRAQKYAQKVSDRSNGNLEVNIDTYTKSKEPVEVRCKQCGHTWMKRADHLLANARCPNCKAGN